MQCWYFSGHSNFPKVCVLALCTAVSKAQQLQHGNLEVLKVRQGPRALKHTVFDTLQVQEKVKAGLVPMNKYIITKQLTKRPEEYPDAKNQAHVQVALRRRAAGKRDGVMQVALPPSALRL